MLILTPKVGPKVGLKVGPKIRPKVGPKIGTKSAPKLASPDRLFRTNVPNISRAVPYNVRKQHRFQAIATMGQTSYLGVSNVPPDILCAWFAFVEMVTPRGVCSSARAVRSRLCSLCSKGLAGVSLQSAPLANSRWFVDTVRASACGLWNVAFVEIWRPLMLWQQRDY